jgi:hypothetical protein
MTYNADSREEDEAREIGNEFVMACGEAAEFFMVLKRTAVPSSQERDLVDRPISYPEKLGAVSPRRMRFLRGRQRTFHAVGFLGCPSDAHASDDQHRPFSRTSAASKQPKLAQCDQ